MALGRSNFRGWSIMGKPETSLNDTTLDELSPESEGDQAAAAAKASLNDTTLDECSPESEDAQAAATTGTSPNDSTLDECSPESEGHQLAALTGVAFDEASTIGQNLKRPADPDVNQNEQFETIVDGEAEKGVLEQLMAHGGAMIDGESFEEHEPLTALDAAAMIGIAPSSKLAPSDAAPPVREPSAPHPPAIPCEVVPQLEDLEPAPAPQDVVDSHLDEHASELEAAASLLAKLIPIIVATTLVIAIMLGLLPFLRRMLTAPTVKHTRVTNVAPGKEVEAPPQDGVLNLMRRQERKVTPIEEAQRKATKQP
jgi:hypothetical protein